MQTTIEVRYIDQSGEIFVGELVNPFRIEDHKVVVTHQDDDNAVLVMALRGEDEIIATRVEFQNIASMWAMDVI